MVFRLNPEPDGFGFLYGNVDLGGDNIGRVDIMPPVRAWRGSTKLSELPHPTDWVVHIDGEVIGHADSQSAALSLVEKFAAARKSSLSFER